MLQSIFQKKESNLLKKKKSFDENSLFEKMLNKQENGISPEDSEVEEEEEVLEDDEEDNDYNMNYFDPGDEYLDVDGDDGKINSLLILLFLALL